MEVALLVKYVVWVMIVELLNIGIEAAVRSHGHRVERLHQAADMGSAAVLLSLLLCRCLTAATAVPSRRLICG